MKLAVAVSVLIVLGCQGSIVAQNTPYAKIGREFNTRAAGSATGAGRIVTNSAEIASTARIARWTSGDAAGAWGRFDAAQPRTLSNAGTGRTPVSSVTPTANAPSSVFRPRPVSWIKSATPAVTQVSRPKFTSPSSKSGSIQASRLAAARADPRRAVDESFAQAMRPGSKTASAAKNLRLNNMLARDVVKNTRFESVSIGAVTSKPSTAAATVHRHAHGVQQLKDTARMKLGARERREVGAALHRAEQSAATATARARRSIAANRPGINQQRLAVKGSQQRHPHAKQVSHRHRHCKPAVGNIAIKSKPVQAQRTVTPNQTRIQKSDQKAARRATVSGASRNTITTQRKNNVIHVNIYERAERDGSKSLHAVYSPIKARNPLPHPQLRQSGGSQWVGQPKSQVNKGHLVKINGVTDYHRLLNGTVIIDKSKRSVPTK